MERWSKLIWVIEVKIAFDCLIILYLDPILEPKRKLELDMRQSIKGSKTSIASLKPSDMIGGIIKLAS